MSRRRRIAVAMVAALALFATCDVAHAQPASPAAGDAVAAPPYTLEVDSDAPDVVSFEALAARIASDLGSEVVRPGALAASRAAITVRYRDRELVVHVVHAGGRVIERTVRAEGDGAAIQREAALLAGNLARDEAREILDALASRPADPPPAAPPPPSAPSASAPGPDEGTVPVSAALFFPVATNYARPNATSYFDVSLLYGRVGTTHGLQLGTGVVYSSRGVVGAQLGAAVTIADGNVSGARIAGALNLSRSRSIERGVAIAGGANVALGEVTGVQAAPYNQAGAVDGMQFGVVNVARKVRGVQIGVVNVADEVDGASIGIISVTRGGVHPIAWTSNLEYTNVGVKFATKYVYTIAAFHYGTLETGFGRAVGMTAALGGRIPLPARFDLEVQGAVTNVSPSPKDRPKDTNLWVAPQLIAGYSFAPHLRVFAGGGARLPIIVDLGREVVRPEVLAGVQF